MIKQDIYIFVDLDGVLADFESHAIAHNKYDENGKLDYDALTYEWWSTMPVFAGAEQFFKELHQYGEVRFLTGPMLSVDCYQGKAEWIKNGFQSYFGKISLKKLIICNSKDKHFLAAPNRLLIDDRKSNVKDWRNAGGIAIHHTGDFSETLARLKAHLARSPVSQPHPSP